jgi:hypothetical protein
MPAKSAKQERFMQAVAHNPKFAKKVGVPTKVGKEFTKSEGGMAESKKMVGKEVAFMKKKGAPKSMVKHEMGEMKEMKKMAMGGPSNPGSMPRPRGPVMPGKPMPPGMAPTRGPVMPGKPMPPGMMKKGGVIASKMGSVRTAAPSKDGIASKGKTKGKMITMKSGGKTC